MEKRKKNKSKKSCRKFKSNPAHLKKTKPENIKYISENQYLNRNIRKNDFKC